MFRWQRFHLIFAVYGLLASVSAFITVWALFLIPSDPRNSIFLGLSLQRLVMLGSVSFAGVLPAVFAVKAYRDIAWSERVWFSIFGNESLAAGIRWAAATALIFSLVVFFMPLYRFGDFQDDFIRISPIVAWLIFFSMLTFLVTWVEKYGLNGSHLLGALHVQKTTLKITTILIIVFALIWVFIAKTGLGLWVSDGYWYEPGVPILSLQVIFAFAIGMSVLFFERSSLSVHLPARSDLLIFFLLWGITAFFWAREPLRPSFFSPGPYAPNNAFHPYSDAATFDLGSQFALIGQGINNGVFFDRALYMAFLVFLHKLAGQDYVQIITLQAVIYAVFPAVLYLLGKAVHSRSFGFILAVLAILRGINGIAAGSMINLANQKQMLTDFPTAIFVAWFALMMVGWLKSPFKNYLYALWAGGVIGLAVMLRTNVVSLMALAVLLAGIVYWRQKLRGALVGFLLVLSMFASTFAWGIYNDKSIFDVYIYRILLVMEARYPQPATPEPASQGSESPSFKLANQNQGTASPGKLHLASSFESRIADPSQLISIPPQHLVDPEIQKGGKKTIPVFVTTHFLHNMITSVLILPTTPYIHTLQYILKNDASFWQLDLKSSLAYGAGFFLTLNLLLIALGIGTSWKSSGLPGLVPLGVFLFYNLANALARTSGGRYIVPMDWIVLFYFALGLFQVILWGLILFGFKDQPDIKNKSMTHNVDNPSWTWEPLKKAPWVILVFLLIGSSLPVSAQISPRRYPAQTQTELLALLDQEGYLQKMGFDRAALTAFSEQSPSFIIINGRALYPRFFRENAGVRKDRHPYSIMGFPRIAFTVIGPNGVGSVILPQGEVLYFPNASDVIVLGCQQSGYIDALSVVVIKDQQVVYVRQPSSGLQCPLPQPVCNENHVCR